MFLNKNLFCSFIFVSGVVFAAQEPTPFERFCNSEYPEAIAAYDAEFQKNIDARMCRGQAYWAQGDYERGARDFEARIEGKGFKPLANPLPLHSINEKTLRGKTVIVREDPYGIGDTFTFLRSCKRLKDCGARVELDLGKKFLKPLLGESKECFDGFYDPQAQALEQKGDDEAPYEVYMMSLPWWKKDKAGKQEVVHIGAYIHPLGDLIFEWCNKLNDGSRPIAICWQSSTLPVPGGRVLDKRSMPLAILARLATIKDVRLYSVQSGGHYPVTQEAYDQKKAAGTLGNVDELDILPVGQVCTEFGQKPQGAGVTVFDKNFDGNNRAFCDTAALMIACGKLGGKVVSVDTSISNLGGAIGADTIMVMPYLSDSRWGKKPGARAAECRFHQTVKEYWQGEDCKWEPVVQAVKEDLEPKKEQEEEKEQKEVNEDDLFDV